MNGDSTFCYDDQELNSGEVAPATWQFATFCSSPPILLCSGTGKFEGQSSPFIHIHYEGFAHSVTNSQIGDKLKDKLV